MNWMKQTESVNHSVVLDSAAPWAEATRFLCPWGSLGKNIAVGCHSLLQGGLPSAAIKPGSPTMQADSLLSEPQGSLLTEWLNSKSFWPGLAGFHSCFTFSDLGR